MLGRFLPKQHGFLELFEQMAELSMEAAHVFMKLMADPQHSEKYSSKIKSIEQHADEITHHTLELLHETFITPIDREDIFELAKRLDDVLDFIDGAAQRMTLYQIDRVPAEMLTLAELTLESVQCVKNGVACLRDLKNREAVQKVCVEIHRLENECDHKFRLAVAKLFQEENDIKRLIKLKEVLELLEGVSDRCEDAADVIEGIVIEHA